MKFIKLKSIYLLKSVWVNASNINALTPSKDDSKTYVAFGKEDSDIAVKETPEQILKLINS